MVESTGHVFEVRSGVGTLERGLSRVFIACSPRFIPKPGQYVVATTRRTDDHWEEAPLAEILFPAWISDEPNMPSGFWAYNIYIEKIRAFIAVELPDFLKEELGRIESILKAGNTTPVKWVDFESIHLTLKFLGDIESDRISQILEGIRSACAGISSFELEIKGMGVFPNPARARIAWVGLVDATDELNLLQRNIEAEMKKLGCERETRKFSPHLTLARVRDQATPEERKRFGNLVKATTFSSASIRIDSISLMKSRLTRQGAIYTRIGSIRLK